MIYSLLTILLLVFLYYFNIIIVYEKLIWIPWLNFWGDSWILQISLIILLYYLYTVNNPYTILFYLFLLIIIAGIYLSFYQAELFTAFLWVIELTVILVSILLLFYLNVSGTLPVFMSNSQHKFKIILFINMLLYFLFIPNMMNSELLLNDLCYFYYIWVDYYETLQFSGVNDMLSLTISYYTLNNLELIFMGFLLLVGSVICVNINKHQRQSRNVNVKNDMSIFNIYNYLLNSVFMRKQGLTGQNSTKASLNFFKKAKKKKIFTEKK